MASSTSGVSRNNSHRHHHFKACFVLTVYLACYRSNAFTPQQLPQRSLAQHDNSPPFVNRQDMRRPFSEIINKDTATSALDKNCQRRQRSLITLLEQQSPNNSPNSNSTASNSKLLLPFTAAVTLSLATLAAFTNHLPGPLIDATAPPPFLATIPYGVIFAGSCDPYSPSLILRDLSSTIFSIVAATVFVKLCTYPTTIGKLESRDARKIVHTLAAPLFLFVWPLFSNAYGARVFASIVPILLSVRLFVAGTGGNSEEDAGSENELAKAISRSGDVKEALQGPLVYTLVLLISTFLFWTDSPIGVVAIATMALGDGLADLVGRRLGSTNKWPFNTSKSMAGSAAFVVGSFLGSFGLISWLVGMGVMDPLGFSTLGLMGRLSVISVVCAGIELLPVVDDNWSVPISAAALAVYLLH